MLGCGIVMVSCSIKGADMKTNISDLLHSKIVPDVSSFTETDRNECIAELRTTSPTNIRASRLLIELGDKFAIEEAIKKYRSSNPVIRMGIVRSLKMSRNATLIGIVAEDLYRTEPTMEKRVSDDLSVEPYSVESADIMRCIIINCKHFHGDVKKWATSLNMYQVPGGAVNRKEQLRVEMKQWWEENKDNMRNGNFAAVRPPKLQNPKNSEKTTTTKE
jgi:hypothetical protein